MSLYAPFSRPLYVMLKPVGARCNLACRYCYYTEKARLYKEEAQHLMSDDLLERFTREYIESQTVSEILFTWHGGEPLMRPLDFYRKALQLQQKYARGRSIDNCIQTNGTLLTDDWCRFLKENGWLVGVSIDGPRRFHDACRCDGRGEPSFERVMRGIEMLDKYGVEWNAMAVINSFNADYPLEFYDFFRQIGCKYIQFTPVVERIKRSPDGRVLAHVGDKGDCELTPFSVTPPAMGRFSLRIVRRVGESRCRKLFYPAFRCHIGQLGRRGTRDMHPFSLLRSCFGYGVERRCLRLRSFCFSRV